MANLFKDLLGPTDQPRDIMSTTAASPVVVETTIPHGYVNGDAVLIKGVTYQDPMDVTKFFPVTEVNNVSPPPEQASFFYAKVLTPTTFEIYFDAGFAQPVSATMPGVSGSVVKVVGPTVIVSDMEEAKTIVCDADTIRNFELQANDGGGFVKLSDFVRSTGFEALEPLSQTVFHLEATVKEMRLVHQNQGAGPLDTTATGAPMSAVIGAKAA